MDTFIYRLFPYLNISSHVFSSFATIKNKYGTDDHQPTLHKFLKPGTQNYNEILDITIICWGDKLLL